MFANFLDKKIKQVSNLYHGQDYWLLIRRLAKIIYVKCYNRLYEKWVLSPLLQRRVATTKKGSTVCLHYLAKCEVQCIAGQELLVRPLVNSETTAEILLVNYLKSAQTVTTVPLIDILLQRIKLVHFSQEIHDSGSASSDFQR